MVSHNTARLLGYFYAGLCLCSSILLMINATQLIQGKYDWAVTTGVCTLIFSIISIVFDVFLIAGIVMRRTKYVKYHLKFVSVLYALAMVGLFVGCIIMGVALGPIIDPKPAITLVFMALTEFFIFGISLLSIFFALTIWILNGVMNFIKHEMMHFVPSEGGDLI